MRDKLLNGWRRVKQSAMLYGVLGTVVRIGANLILLPIVLSKLSTAELRLWWVFLALGGVATLADFGFGQAISRVYSYLWAGAEDFDTIGLRPPPANHEPNVPRLLEFNATVRFLYWRLSLVVVVLLAVGGTFFLLDPIRSWPHPERIWLVWAIYVVCIAYTLGTSYWALACQGINRVRDLQAANLWSGLAYVVSVAVLLLAGFGLASMVVGTALRGFVTRQVCRKSYLQALPEAASERAKPEMMMLKKLWPNAWKFGVLSLGVYLINNGTILICSNYLGDATTASYGLTVQVSLFIVGVSSLWLTVKLPQLTMLRMQGKLEQMGVIFARRLALSMATYAGLALLLMLLGDQLLEWKGAHTRLIPKVYLLVYLVYLGQQLIYGQFGNLTFTENVIPFFKISLFTGLGLMVLSVMMTPRYGLWGLILSPLIAAQVCASWYPIWRGFRGQPLSLKQFLRAAFTGRAG